MDQRDCGDLQIHGTDADLLLPQPIKFCRRFVVEAQNREASEEFDQLDKGGHRGLSGQAHFGGG